MSRPKKAKQWPAKYPRRWNLVAAVHLLKHLRKTDALESYPWEPARENDEHPVDEVIRTIQAVGRGKLDGNNACANPDAPVDRITLIIGRKPPPK
jgi:hypothetical protein